MSRVKCEICKQLVSSSEASVVAQNLETRVLCTECKERNKMRARSMANIVMCIANWADYEYLVSKGYSNKFAQKRDALGWHYLDKVLEGKGHEHA